MIPDLAQSLGGVDLRHIEIVAELWGIELESLEREGRIDELVPQLLSPELFEDILEALPPAALQALSDLQRHGGRIAWPLFTRRYGGVRQMGRGRRARELPHRAPSSSAEMLWYRGLVGRAFFDAPAGPEEFAYIPREFLPLLAAVNRPPMEGNDLPAPGRRARQEEFAAEAPAGDLIVDHTCTLLAGLRLGLDEAQIRLHLPLPVRPLRELLTAAGLIDEQGLPRPEETGEFLRLARADGLAKLSRAWRSSQEFIELGHVPHLLLEGNWGFDPRRGREVILGYLGRLPVESWWNLASFVESIRRENPDFLRPAGDYDSWYIRHSESGNYLRGVEHWDEVDGAYIRYLLIGPLHWLGVLDLASREGSPDADAFRLSQSSEALLNGEPPEGVSQEQEQVAVRSDGRLAVPRLVPRATRYQIARFCVWEEMRGPDYAYRMTGGSLEKARDQGLRAAPILALLAKSSGSVPPNITRALDHWERTGAAGQIEKVSILRLASPDILTALRKSRAARFLGDPLSPTTVIVKHGAESKVLEVLVELGYFGTGE